jgi:tetratricopeptide (TPR) repeat protein
MWRARRCLPVISALVLVPGFSACALGPAPVEQATLLADRGRTDDAIRTLDEHLAQHPDAVDERRLLIRLHGAAANWDAAIQQTERLAEYLPPGSPVPWVELGAAYELGHRYDEALGAYDRAATTAPADALGPKHGGMRAARWGELELAEPRLREATRRAPADAEAWHALGVVLVGLGKLDAARQAYTTGIAADPGALENRLGLATVALRLNEPAVALAQYELLLDARPKFTDALLGKSWSLILMGQYGSAEEALREAQRLGADPAAIMRQRGELRAREQAMR